VVTYAHDFPTITPSEKHRILRSRRRHSPRSGLVQQLVDGWVFSLSFSTFSLSCFTKSIESRLEIIVQQIIAPVLNTPFAPAKTARASQGFDEASGCGGSTQRTPKRTPKELKRV
jgi:hypothetical protein